MEKVRGINSYLEIEKVQFDHDTYRPQPFYHTWLNHWFHMYLLFCGPSSSIHLERVKVHLMESL